MKNVIEIRTGKNIEETSAALELAVANHQFGVMGIHDLRKTMAKKGVEFGNECRVFEVCNPHQAKKVLEENMAISTALPCRISVYNDGDQTVLATIAPSAMLGMFGADGIAPVAEEVEATIRAIMEEAASA
jgi:uncharacterized protein (DUF302 family)